jgi:hypothetical protein
MPPPSGGRWAEEALLPLVYWEHQVVHTRYARRKTKIRQALEAMQVAFSPHALTQYLPPQALKEWQAWADPPGEGLSASLVRRGGPQLCPGATASQSAEIV